MDISPLHACQEDLKKNYFKDSE